MAPARFDLLRPNRFLGDPTRPYGRVDVGTDDDVYVGDGWYGPERDGDITFRWAGDQAVVLIPLDHPSALLFQVQLRAFDYPDAPPQMLSVAINGHALDGPVIGGGWQRVELPTNADVWRKGLNRVSLRFSRATRPADIGGQDGRRLAAAVDFVRIQVASQNASPMLR